MFGPYTATTYDTSACSGSGNGWATDTYSHYYVVNPQPDGSFLVTNVMNGTFSLNGNANVPGFAASAASSAPSAFDGTSSLTTSPSADGWYLDTGGATCPVATFASSPSGSGTFEAYDTYYVAPGTAFDPFAVPSSTSGNSGSEAGIHNTQFFSSVFGTTANPANITELNNQFNYVYTPTSGSAQYFSQWMTGGTAQGVGGNQYAYGNITG